jgi:predicted nucleic acid-binding Zn ribbon protein
VAGGVGGRVPSVAPELVQEPVPEPVTDSATQRCLLCGMGLSSEAKLRPHKFCSDACRYAWHSRRRSEISAPAREKVCVVCGVAFTATRSHAKTCSERCRTRLKRQRRR